MAIAFVQCIGGVSGDMLLGALLDAGLPPEALQRLLAPLGVRLRAWEDRRAGLTGTRVALEWDRPAHLDWPEMHALLDRAPLAPPDRERAHRVLSLLEEAERSAHREPHPPEELGTPDTPADLVGVVGGLRLLGVERLYASPLPAGLGVVERPHGTLPAPAPATLHLLARCRAPVVPPPAGGAGETLTPTGVALLCALAEFRQPPMRLTGVGYGLGARNPTTHPNALALWLGEPLPEEEEGPLVLLETNLDDATPQALAWVHERLLALGARDAWLTPVLMKKGRPGVVVSALVDPALEGPAVDLLMRETPTLGVRRRPVARHEAEREVLPVETPYGPVRVKVKRWRGRVLSISPEYEDCRGRALERGVPLGEVMDTARRTARTALGLEGPAP